MCVFACVRAYVHARTSNGYTGVDGVIAQLQESEDGTSKWVFYDDDFDDADSSEVCVRAARMRCPDAKL